MLKHVVSRVAQVVYWALFGRLKSGKLPAAWPQEVATYALMHLRLYVVGARILGPQESPYLKATACIIRCTMS